jgi:hypothetical protein
MSVHLKISQLLLQNQFTVYTLVYVDPCISRIELLKSKFGLKFQIFEKQYFISKVWENN